MKKSTIIYTAIIILGASAISYMYFLSDFANEEEEAVLPKAV